MTRSPATTLHFAALLAVLLLAAQAIGVVHACDWHEAGEDCGVCLQLDRCDDGAAAAEAFAAPAHDAQAPVPAPAASRPAGVVSTAFARGPPARRP